MQFDRKYEYHFKSRVDKRVVGQGFFTVVYLPQKLIRCLPFKEFPRLRIYGHVAGEPFEGAWQPAGGRYYLLLSKRFLKDVGKELGDKIEVSFSIDDQEAINMPAELEAALNEYPHKKARWDTLTVGKRRSFCIKLHRARRPETREKHIFEILDQL